MKLGTRVFGIALAVCVSATAAGCAIERAPGQRAEGRTGSDVIYALAMDPDGTVPGGSSMITAIDTGKRAAAGRPIRLRSACYSMVGSGSTAYTAQTGGLEEDTDKALGVADLKSGAVTYVPIKQTPSKIALGTDGRLYLDTGAFHFNEQDWMISKITAVDPSSGAAEGLVVPGVCSSQLFADGNRLIFAATTERQGVNKIRNLIVSLDTSKRVATVLADSDSVALYPHALDGDRLYASVLKRSGSESIVSAEFASLEVGRRGLKRGWSASFPVDKRPVCATVAGSKVLVGAWDEASGKSDGEVVALDASSGRVIRRYKNVPGPASIVVVDDVMWVAAETANAAIAYRLSDGAEIARIPVGVSPNLLVQPQRGASVAAGF